MYWALEPWALPTKIHLNRDLPEYVARSTFGAGHGAFDDMGQGVVDVLHLQDDLDVLDRPLALHLCALESEAVACPARGLFFGPGAVGLDQAP